MSKNSESKSFKLKSGGLSLTSIFNVLFRLFFIIVAIPAIIVMISLFNGDSTMTILFTVVGIAFLILFVTILIHPLYFLFKPPVIEINDERVKIPSPPLSTFKFYQEIPLPNVVGFHAIYLDMRVPNRTYYTIEGYEDSRPKVIQGTFRRTLTKGNMKDKVDKIKHLFKYNLRTVFILYTEDEKTVKGIQVDPNELGGDKELAKVIKAIYDRV